MKSIIQNKLPTIFALLAVLLSAFGVASRPTQYIFEYDGTGNYQSEAAVENEANWDLVSTNPDDLDCDDISRKACRIQVAEIYVNHASSPVTLLTTANVQALMYDGLIFDTYYVVLTGSNISDKTNQNQ